MVPPDSRRIARVPRYSGTCYALRNFTQGAVTLYGRPFQVCCARLSDATSQALQPPKYHYLGFGLVPVRSPLLGESLSCLLFLRVLRCFTSPGLLPEAYVFGLGIPAIAGGWVAPFGNLRIKACERLPAAYRSCPRPSSPLIAKASTVCP